CDRDGLCFLYQSGELIIHAKGGVSCDMYLQQALRSFGGTCHTHTHTHTHTHIHPHTPVSPVLINQVGVYSLIQHDDKYKHGSVETLSERREIIHCGGDTGVRKHTHTHTHTHSLSHTHTHSLYH